MPFDYVIDKEHRLVISTGSGVLTAQEVVNHAERLKRDPAFDPDFCQLTDLTPVTELRIDPQEIKGIAEIALFSPGSRRAIIAPNPHFFGMSRMYELMRNSRTTAEQAIHVFKDRSAAMEWLDCGLK